MQNQSGLQGQASNIGLNQGSSQGAQISGGYSSAQRGGNSQLGGLNQSGQAGGYNIQSGGQSLAGSNLRSDISSSGA